MNITSDDVLQQDCTACGAIAGNRCSTGRFHATRVILARHAVEMAEANPLDFLATISTRVLVNGEDIMADQLRPFDPERLNGDER